MDEILRHLMESFPFELSQLLVSDEELITFDSHTIQQSFFFDTFCTFSSFNEKYHAVSVLAAVYQR